MKTSIISIIITLAMAATTSYAADLNKDNAEVIARDCKGIGPKIAARVIEDREKNGPFANYEDLQKRIKGIGEKKRESIRSQETCNIETTNTNTNATKGE